MTRSRAVQAQHADLRAVEIGQVDVLQDRLLVMELPHADHGIDDLVRFRHSVDPSSDGAQTRGLVDNRHPAQRGRKGKTLLYTVSENLSINKRGNKLRISDCELRIEIPR